MGEQCLPGLQGYPIQVNGWAGFTDRASIETPNDIELQFSPSETPRHYNNGILDNIASNTFFIGGVQYNVVQVALAQPRQEGISNFSGTPLAEFQIWGSPTVSYNSSKTIAALIIPVIQKPVEDIEGASIVAMCTGKAARLVGCVPKGRGVDVVRYSTCIETSRKDTVNIQVAYWANGAAITRELARVLPQAKQPIGIPDVFGYTLLTSFNNQIGLRRMVKVDTKFEKANGRLTPYSTTTSVASPEFRGGFRLIRNFIQVIKGSTDTSAYKCIAIDRSRDIKGGKLLVDPNTGIRLTDEVAVANAREAELLQQAGVTNAGDLWIKACIALGVVLGVCLIAAAFVFVGTVFYNRKGQGLPPSSVVVPGPAATGGTV